MPLLSILVPVFNEQRTIADVIARLDAVAFPVPHEVIVIDDGSTDGTREVLDRLDGRPGLRIVHARVNGGKGTAVRLGLAHARGDFVAIQDADLELDPAQIADLLVPLLRDEADVVYGSRFLAGRPRAPLRTIVANRVVTALTNLLYGSRLTDMETCYKVMRTSTARALDLQARRFDIEPEITAKVLKAGLRLVERPVRFEPRSRAAGKKIRWWDGLEAILALVRVRLR